MQIVTVTFKTEDANDPSAVPVESTLKLGSMSTRASLQVQSDLLALQAHQLARQAEKEGVVGRVVPLVISDATVPART